MKDEIVILAKIKSQIAHCMAWYGDQPEELMHKLEQLVIEWYEKGKNNNGVRVTCPHCEFTSMVYHLQWSTLVCPKCKAEIKEPDWKR